MDTFRCVRGGLVFSTLVFIAACSHLSTSQSANNVAASSINQLQFLPAELSTTLAMVSADTNLILPGSSWRPATPMQVRQRFFAASGRICLDVLLDEEPALLCDYQQQGWALLPYLGNSDDLDGIQP